MTSEISGQKIAVLMGGPGTEREVSLATGRGVSKALRSLGAEVVDIDVRDKNFKLPEDVDLAFIALHGTFGEDGQVQKFSKIAAFPTPVTAWKKADWLSTRFAPKKNSVSTV